MTPASAAPPSEPRSAPPRLTLCLIARDEAALLGACLASVRDVVDECVVCDTGSTDATVAIATAAGAQVVHHAWDDDFSAARNHALSAATGDWVLLLDADERLLPGTGDALRAAVATDAFDCGMLPLHHADGLDAPPLEVVRGPRRHQEPTALARLFRRTPDLRWEGIIHESPETWMAQPGRTVAHVPVPIVHYGNVPDLREARAKAERNLRLLERHCTRHPTDAPRRTYLARERLRAGDTPGARAEAEAAWRVSVARMETTGAPAPSAPFCATMAAFLRLSGRDPAGCLEVVATARAHGLRHPNLAVLHATAVLERAATPDDLEAAAAGLEAVLADPHAVYVDELLPGARGPTAQRLLGQLRMRQDSPAAALVALQAAHAQAPDDPHARLALAELHIHQRAPAPALALVEPLLAAGHPDAWLVAAEAAVAAGQRGQADALLSQASASRQPFFDRRRARRADRLRAEQAAWQRLRGLTGGRPPPPAPSPDSARDLAAAALDHGRLGRALQLLPAVLAARPGDVVAWCLLATACLRQGGLPMARDLLGTARLLSTHHPAVLELLAELARHEGHTAAARTWSRLRTALHGPPPEPPPLS